MGPYSSSWQALKYQVAYHLRSLQTLAASQRPRQPDTIRVVFLGDSRVRAWPAPASVDLGMQIEIINRGMGLDSSAQTLQRLGKHALPLQPNITLLQIGVNDFKYRALTDRPLSQIVSDLTANIEQIVNQLIQQQSIVILSSIFPVCFELWQDKQHKPEEFATGIEAANRALSQLAPREKLRLFDAASLLIDQKKSIPTRYALDGLHINTAAYQHLNRELQTILEEVVQLPSS
jgi:lysophospholipase L1-like esterase